jgi:hypothetical protein
MAPFPGDRKLERNSGLGLPLETPCSHMNLKSPKELPKFLLRRGTSKSSSSDLRAPTGFHTSTSHHWAPTPWHMSRGGHTQTMSILYQLLRNKISSWTIRTSKYKEAAVHLLLRVVKINYECLKLSPKQWWDMFSYDASCVFLSCVFKRTKL